MLSRPHATAVSSPRRCPLPVRPLGAPVLRACGRRHTALHVTCSGAAAAAQPDFGGGKNVAQSAVLTSSAPPPPLVTEVRYGVVGSSRFAKQLRRELRTAREAAASAVLVRGEPGLHKDKLASLVHFGSSPAHKGAPLARLSCASLKPWRLFGLVDDDGTTVLRTGALDWLAQQPHGASLLLDDCHALPSERDASSHLRQGIAQLLSLGKYQRTDRHGAPIGPLLDASAVRLLLTAEGALASDLADANPTILTIKVPPLRVRRADIPAIIGFTLRLVQRQIGARLPAPPGALRGAFPQPPQLTRSAMKLAEGAEYANNETELEVLVRGALAHASALRSSGGGGSAAWPEVLDSTMLWSPTLSRRLARETADLFAWFPALKAAWRSPLWPEWINQNVTRWVFPVVVALLLFGPQTRDANPALNVFWCYWWPLVLATFPVVGRLWCAVCPFSIYGDWAQRTKLALGGVVGPWPRQAAEQYGGAFLYTLFGGILVWEELCDLPNNAAQSGLLLLLITTGAVIGSLAYERRFWCRYLCPIGGMNGMFAKLAFVELRADRGVCTAECSSYACINGGAGQPPGQPGCDRGMATAGCPLHSHPSSLPDNRDCTFCGSCVKACPNGNIQFRLRPPGADLWEEHTATRHESALMFMLLGAIGVHEAPRLLIDIFSIPHAAVAAIMHSPWQHGALSAALLVLPGAAAWGADALLAATSLSPKAGASVDSFVRLSYGWLPLVWAASLAYYVELFGSEAGLVLSTAAHGLFNLPADSVPHAVLAPPVVAFLQAAFLLLGGGAATALTWKLGTEVAPARAVSQAGGIAAAGLVLWHLIVRTDFLQG